MNTNISDIKATDVGVQTSVCAMVRVARSANLRALTLSQTGEGDQNRTNPPYFFRVNFMFT